MTRKITIQDIADSLGLSRNTVSKALNNHSEVPDETRDRILQKASDLNYKKFSLMKSGNIALLTRSDINAISFYSETIRGMETQLSSQGYNLILTLVNQDDIQTRTLPNNINQSNVAGIVCIEIFDKAYIETVLEAGIPTIFIDSLPNIVFPGHKYDIIMVENEFATYSLTQLLVDHGHKEIGFIGDLHHCRSFYERWLGFDRALRENGISSTQQFNITFEDTNPYLSIEWMTAQLRNLDKLPSAFVCANDDIGISITRALKEMNYKIPEQIEVVGFDNIAKAEIIDPPLTTVDTYPYELGVRVVEAVFARILAPKRNNEIIHMETCIIRRGSTK